MPLVLVFNWFDFHLSSFSGVLRAFPVIPLYACPGRRMLAVIVDAIQVGMVTIVEPPGALTNRSTAARILVIVAIFGGER